MQVHRILVLFLFLNIVAASAGGQDLPQAPPPQAAPGFALDPFVPQAAQDDPHPPAAVKPIPEAPANRLSAEATAGAAEGSPAPATDNPVEPQVLEDIFHLPAVRPKQAASVPPLATEATADGADRRPLQDLPEAPPAPQPSGGATLVPLFPPTAQDAAQAPSAVQASEMSPVAPLSADGVQAQPAPQPAQGVVPSPVEPPATQASPPGQVPSPTDAPQLAAAEPKAEEAAPKSPELPAEPDATTSNPSPETAGDDSSPLPPQWVLDAIASQSAAEAPADPAQGAGIAQATEEQQYPKIVLFSTSWCPHCKMAKEYLVRNNIPFINRDVDEDREALNLLLDKYKSQSVPFFVFGDDAEVMNGFTEERFQKAVEKAKNKK